MFLRVLAVCLMIRLTTEAKEWKRSNSDPSHKCKCKHRALQIKVKVVKSPAFSCDEICLDKRYKDSSWTIPHGYQRMRRENTNGKDGNLNIVNYSALCHKKKKTDPRLIRQLRVTFREEGNASSWYVQWTPIVDYPGTWYGYCLNYVEGRNPPVTDTKTSFLWKNITRVNITSSWGEKLLNVAVFGLSVSANETIVIRMYPYGPTEVAPGTLPFRTASHKSNTDPNHYKVAFVPISIGIVFGVILVGALMWYFSHRKKEYPPLPYDFQYHAFIIYSHEDSHWMKKQLLPLLEEKHHLTCCIHYKDFIPGKPIRDNMTDSVYTSYKVIALFSKNFVNSSCCMYELDVAVNRLVQKRDNSLAIIRIDGADWERLPAELRGRCFIDYHYLQERPFWGKRLLKFLDLPEECRRESTSEDHTSGNSNNESNCNYEK